jgi:hypothetical protein
MKVSNALVLAMFFLKNVCMLQLMKRFAIIEKIYFYQVHLIRFGRNV